MVQCICNDYALQVPHSLSSNLSAFVYCVILASQLLNLSVTQYFKYIMKRVLTA